MEKLSKNLERIILIRHAETIDRAEFAKHSDNDLVRPLNKKGKKQSKKIAKFLERLHKKSPICVALISPAKRTIQTIKHFTKSHSNFYKKCASIAPECGIEGYLKALRDESGAKTLALVGHQFDLGNFVQCATGITQDLIVKKGTIIELVRKKGANEVRGGFIIATMIAPEYL